MKIQAENPWIKTEEELPPCDGIYEIANKDTLDSPNILSYDGHGFTIQGRCVSYFIPEYWREIKPFKKKRYGKG